MSSLTWFTQPAQPTTTFFPATPFNPPITAKEPPKAAAAEPLPVVPADPFAFPPAEYYTLHPPSNAPSRAKLYALSSPAFTEIASHHAAQQDYLVAPFAKPVHRLPASCADVWNSVHRLLESKWARGESGELSGVMKMILQEIVADEEKKKGK
ncbi:hypothetical protein QFC22_005550 [Naganishia vaughanmartiniae]|uniref:Uncharacterized protein n=1 Tax=Naganishia vaughanmartiniae TaxID=1424756 RepID=A0ACC2WU51_9TREE|nr:hypothetical protein QFC22_005550 [Naganishia vaughanmartiniae]